MIGIRVENADETTLTRYFHTDHLGSIAVITNETGAVVERLSCDAWGVRRYPDGTPDPSGSIASSSSRGFTGHEHLAEVGLIHMNGRVYDPLLARFGTPDPTTEDPFSTQGWNRYAYVGNSPLNFTDPSGYCFLGCFWKPIFKAIGTFFKQNWGAILQIAATAMCWGNPVCGAIVGSATSAFVVGVSGGSLGDALRAGLTSAATVVAMWGVGELTGGFNGVLDAKLGGHGPLAPGSEAHLFNIAGHALVGCASSVARGSNCGSGALAGAIGPTVAPGLKGQTFEFRLVANTVMGGAASIAGGGTFANGAVTAAFGYLFNSMWHSRRPVPFLDDDGQQVLDINGRPMMRPSDVDPHYFLGTNMTGTPFEALGELMNFRIGGAWDVQRVGPNLQFTPDFVDFSTVMIGLYGAANGIPIGTLLDIENTYAGMRSTFAPNTVMDKTFTNLPAVNVWNTMKGYELYHNEKIR
jgi:RHS repeat-associated protein